MKLTPFSAPVRARLVTAREALAQCLSDLATVRTEQAAAVSDRAELEALIDALLKSGKADAQAAQQLGMLRAQLELNAALPPFLANREATALAALGEPLKEAKVALCAAFEPTRQDFLDRLFAAAQMLYPNEAVREEQLRRSPIYYAVGGYPSDVWFGRADEEASGRLVPAAEAVLAGEVRFAFEPEPA